MTFLGCSNASESRRYLLVLINKSSKHRCFKHISMVMPPVHYMSKNHGWNASYVEFGSTSRMRHLYTNSVNKTDCMRSEVFFWIMIPLTYIPHCTSTMVGSAEPCSCHLPPPPSSRRCTREWYIPPSGNIGVKVSLISSWRMIQPKGLSAISWKKNEGSRSRDRSILARATKDSLKKAWHNLLQDPSNNTDRPVIEDILDIKEGLADSAGYMGEESQHNISEWLNSVGNEIGHRIQDDDEMFAEIVWPDEELFRNDNVDEQ